MRSILRVPLCGPDEGPGRRPCQHRRPEPDDSDPDRWRPVSLPSSRRLCSWCGDSGWSSVACPLAARSLAVSHAAPPNSTTGCRGSRLGRASTTSRRNSSSSALTGSRRSLSCIRVRLADHRSVAGHSSVFGFRPGALGPERLPGLPLVVGVLGGDRHGDDDEDGGDGRGCGHGGLLWPACLPLPRMQDPYTGRDQRHQDPAVEIRAPTLAISPAIGGYRAGPRSRQTLRRPEPRMC
jgi:hypothetical protein